MLGNPETSRVNAKGAAQTPGRERGTASMRSPAPTPELGGGEAGHKGCARPPLWPPAALEPRGDRDPTSEVSPARPRPSPSPGKVWKATPWALGDTRGEAASQPGSPFAMGTPPLSAKRARRPCSRHRRLSHGPSTRLQRGLWRCGGRGGGTHVLHGRGHVVVALRLLGQPGFLHQLLAVHHLRGLGRAGRENRGGLKGSERRQLRRGWSRVPGGPTTQRVAERDGGGAKAAARVATAGTGVRRLRLQCVPRPDHPLRSRPRRVTHRARPPARPARLRPSSSASGASPPQIGSPPPSGCPFLSLCLSTLVVLHYTPVPASQLLQMPPLLPHPGPRPARSSAPEPPGSCSSSTGEVMHWRDQGQRGGQYYISQRS